MRRAIFLIIILTSVSVREAYAQKLTAEQITKDNAAARLFSGSDANGGIGDFYLSNGIVEAIVDNAAFQPDLPQGTSLPLQNGVAPSGGNLIDLALVGKNNDQFTQIFQVANIDPNNAVIYLSVTPQVTDTRAMLIADGIALLGSFSSTSNPALRVRTIYSLGQGDQFITISTTVVNAGMQAAPLFNITDALILVGRSILPFAPFPGRGFNNPRLVITPAGIAQALGFFPYVVLPGNLRPEDGLIDTVLNVPCGEISYGFAPVSVAVDPDGTGPMPANVSPIPALFGVNSDLVCALGNPFDPARSPMVPAGATFTYTRRIIVGAKNDAASVTNGIFSSLPSPFTVSVVSGDIGAVDTPDVEANLIFEGKLNLPGLGLIAPIFNTATVPVTEVRTDKTGKYSVVLPPGDYKVTISSPERSDMTAMVTVSGNTTTANFQPLSAVGRFTYTVSEKGNRVPAKLTFVGMNGAPNPDFNRFLTANVFDPATNMPIADLQASTYTSGPAANFIFNSTGGSTQIIKPGTYQVIASRGVEYSVDIKTVTVTAGQETKMDFNLTRVVDTTGFVSADFHVHTGRSFDSSAPIEDRVRSYVAENVEVIVSTDHNFITDYKPVIDKLNLGAFAKTIVGNELTTSLPNPVFSQAFGHHIIFPLVVEPFSPRRGAVATEYVNSATFYDRQLKNNPGVQKVIQLNHPRSGVAGLTLIGLFNIVSFNPTQGIPAQLSLVPSQLGTGRKSIDFDAMELYNGENIGMYQQVRNDWFSLINQGLPKTATAVADSHRVVVETPGFPVSYLNVPTDDPSKLTDAMITSAVLPDKASGAITGKVIGTSGPFIRFDINGSPIGSLITKKKGKVTLNITVSAPAWVPIEQVRILENGKLKMAFDATTNPKVTPAPSDPTSTQGVERFKASIKIKPKGKKDAYYSIEAGIKLPAAVDTNGDGVIDTGDTNGDGKIDQNDSGLVQPPSPPIYAAIAKGFVPLAYTNPIFIDRNGNGKFDPLGVGALNVETADFIRTEPLPDNDPKDYFPWRKLRVGKEEIENFFNIMENPERRLVPNVKDGDEINDKLDLRIDLNKANAALWAFLVR